MTDSSAGTPPGIDVRPGSPPTVVLAGEWDHANAPQLRAVLDELTADSEIDLLQLDFAGASFCDSSILSELIRAYRALSKHAGRLVLLHPRPAIRSYLTVTGLAAFFLGEPETKPNSS